MKYTNPYTMDFTGHRLHNLFFVKRFGDFISIK